MAINFPTGPVVGQLFLGGSLFYEWDGVAWNIVGGTGPSTVTALQNNLVTNPCMQVSQENIDTPGATSTYFMADEWASGFVTSAGVLSFRRAALITPRKSKYRIRAQVTTIDAALAAGEFLQIRQSIEGTKLANLGWDGATGVALVLRFGFKGPAGTYSVSYTNGDATRSYVQNFVVSAGQANTDIEIIMSIPPDTTAGSWVSTVAAGASLRFTVAAGTTFVAAPNVWQTALFLGGTGISNGLGAVSTYEVFDVGLYPDPLNSGIPPAWITPSYEDDLAECQRYWQTIQSYFAANVTSAASYYCSYHFTVPPRTLTPTLVGANAVAGSFPAAVGTLSVMPGGSGVVETRVANGTGSGVYSSVIDVNARM